MRPAIGRRVMGNRLRGQSVVAIALQLVAIVPAAAHTGGLTPADEAWAGRIREQQRDPVPDEETRIACVKYQSIASSIWSMRTHSMTKEYTINWAASQAYGPGGIAFRGSAHAEDLFTGLAEAAYRGTLASWDNLGGFDAYAYRMCIRGMPL